MSEKRRIRVGSRESRLAVEQTMLLLRKIEACHPELEFELVTLKTTGDRILDRSLDQVGGKGLFVKELDKALAERTVDFSVHSLKDMPMEQPEGMPIVALSESGDVRDVLVYPRGRERWKKEDGRPFRIGTSSARRRLQLEKLFPEAEFRLIRGNVLTRLSKLDQGEYDAIVLAAAGLFRLGLEDRIDVWLDTEQVIPAAGQAILAVQGREGEDYSYLDCIDSREAWQRARAERSFVRTLDGGCSSPVCAYAEEKDGRLRLRGLYYDESTGRCRTGEVTGGPEDGEQMGVSLANRLKHCGKVWLVGAGPSDAGLFTLKGKQVLEKAETVVYDRLVGPSILQMMPADAEKIDVGKKAGAHPVPQEEINRILYEKAMEGKRVVRLKGGDPFIFGRGGEELELLAASGIPFEVVPGVTAASAVPAYAGIPVTHRDYCSSVHLITAHKKRGCEEKPDYETLARLDGTLVFYMGLGALGEIMDGLMAAGMDRDMPAAVLERGCTADQRRVVSTVSDLKEAADRAGIVSPALIVVGKVCALADTFHWAEDRPLGRQRVIVTRPKKRSRKMADRLEELGAEVILLPAIETKTCEDGEQFDQVFEHLTDYDWIGFTSAEGVDSFFALMLKRKIDVRSLWKHRFAVIGPATGKALENRGLLPDLQPDTYTGEAMGRLLAETMHAGERLLLARSEIGTPEILKPLEEAKIDYTDLAVYRTEARAGDVEIRPGDIVTFTSASTVRSFMEMLPELDPGSILGLCIGEQTRKAAEAFGIRTVVSERADIDSMIEKLLSIKEEL